MSQSLPGGGVTELVSYTLPCHKREADLRITFPRAILAANLAPPVELVLVDYGHPTPLAQFAEEYRALCSGGVSLLVVRSEQPYFHMAHARNVGLRAARGRYVVLFLADQLVADDFFLYVRAHLSGHPTRLLQWQETFAADREALCGIGGFDERFEFYGPEGKELVDRWQRIGWTVERFPRRGLIDQIPTPNSEKTRHYRERLSKRAMHERGMAIWRANQITGLQVANQGQDWGRA